ncbi:iron-sulfur cluster assembly accessory protein [archaeon]|nr:iron-sulfur cluster assembly accessory protein [archaeon]
MTIELTIAAAEKIKSMIEKRVEEWLAKSTIEPGEKEYYLNNLGFRFGLEGGGCAGFTYKYGLEEKNDEDVVLNQHGVNIYVDPKSYAYLYGSKIDWKENDFESKFVFDVPKSTGGCGCGSSIGFE